METFGSRLKTERKRLGLTQAQLGKIGGVATNAQGHYESGSRYPRADYLGYVAKSGIDIVFVITGFSAAEKLQMHLPSQLEPSAQCLSDRLPVILEHLRICVQSVANALYEISRLHTPDDQAPPDGEVTLRLKRLHDEAAAFVMSATSAKIPTA